MKKSGGQAFPRTSQSEKNYAIDVAGMTLRQWYKAKAMQGMIETSRGELLVSSSTLARISGKIADAMIAEDEEFERGDEK